MAVTFNPFTGTFDFEGSSGGGGTIAGTIANTQVAFGTAADTIGGSNNLTWDGSTLLVTGLVNATTLQQGGKAITLSGNLTTTGAFNPTFAIPSSSTWTFPNGGGTLSTSTGTVTSIATTSPISGGTITSTGTLSLLVNVNFNWTAGQTITAPAGSSALTLAGGTQTSSFPVLNATQTWNSAGVTFTAAKINVTSTASAADSLLLDMQVAGASVFRFGKTIGDGLAFNTGNGANDPAVFGLLSSGTPIVGFYAGGATGFAAYSGGLVIRADKQLSWNSVANVTGGISPDLFLGRVVAATMQMGVDVNGAAVSQMLQAANGTTGTDKTGGNFTLASGKGTGAGAVSSLIFQTPTVLASGTTAQSLATRLTLSSAGLVSTVSATVPGGATFLITSTALTDGAGAGAGTILNAPSAGNPTKWIGINDNGTVRYVPAW